jgi:glycosyltransferase involved in cell wall biosynthesis
MTTDGEMGRPRILLVVNVDWFFLSHRLSLAKEALRQGAEVYVITGDTGRSQAIRNEGLPYWPMPLSRSGTSPISDFRTLRYLVNTYRQLRPDLVHHISIKPVIYGSIAAQIAKVKAVVNTISGLGFAFTSSKRAALLRPLITILYRAALQYRQSRTIFQNPDDRDEFVQRRIVPADLASVIRGSGVDYGRFNEKPEPEGGEPVVMLPSRMIWDKGILEFVNVAREMRLKGCKARFVLVGKPDRGNPGSVPEVKLTKWDSQGIVEWWGHHEDMPEVYSRASIIVLPTKYREGIPMVLLEAAACGRPLIATDSPGCREIVRPDVNGFLIPMRDHAALVQSIQILLGSRSLRRQFGLAGREIVLKEFAQELVLERNLRIYRELLNGKWPQIGQTSR